MKRAALPLFLCVLSVCYVVSNVQILKSGRGEENPAPVSLGLPRQSDRVVLIVLDGVPVRVAYDNTIMPFLGELAGEGASGVLRAPKETTTPAGVRALATGNNTSAADMLDMFRETEYTGWTIFDDIVRRGEKVSLSGDKAWTSLLASRDPGGARVADTETRLYQDAQYVLTNAAKRIESAQPPALTVVHLSETDRLGHLYGTESPQYKSRMRAIDDQLRAFVKRVVADNSTLLVTADHGNDVFGSHGGEGDVYRNVPIIMTGQGVQKGAKITMDARALPGVLAVLLGTRVPAEMQGVIPAQAFSLTDSQRATLVRANAAQLQHLFEIRGLELPASVSAGLRRIGETGNGSQSDPAVSMGPKILSSVVDALDEASPLSVPRILWALVLFSALFIVAFEVLWPVSRSGNTVNNLLRIVMGLVVLCLTLPRLAVPLLAMTLAIEIMLVAFRVMRTSSRASLLGAGAAIMLVVLAIARFAYMPQIKVFLQTTPMRLALLIAIVLGFVSLVVMRRRRAIQLHAETATFFVAAFLFAIALLAPFSSVPALLIVVSLIAIRSGGSTWTEVAWVAAALGAFFFLSERVGFARTGEAPLVRYAYVALTGAILTAALMLRSGKYRRWLALAWVLLVPVWPFGYLKIGNLVASPMAAAMVVALPLAIAAWVGARRIRFWWAYLPLVGSLSYHIHPTHALFWLALTAHLAVFGAVAVLPASNTTQRSLTALTALSGLILMSPVSLAPSVLLVGLGVFAATRIDVQRLSPSTIILLGAALLVFGRYAFIGVFSHGPGIGCTLECIDEASGFYGFDETRWTWAAGLITLKMLLASMVLISVGSLNRAFESTERNIVVTAMLLTFALIAKAGMESALSFGPLGARLGVSLSQAGYNAIVLLALGLGYVAYRLALNGGRTREVILPELSQFAA
jgi:hypothetical protein